MNDLELIQKAKNEKITRLVVGAIIVKSEKILFLKRPDNEYLGGIFELPSGKVETNETLKEALIREVKEETNLDIHSVVNFIDSFDYESKSGKRTRQFNYLIDVKNGNIQLTEHVAFKWVLPEMMNKYNITDSVQNTIMNYLNSK